MGVSYAQFFAAGRSALVDQARTRGEITGSLVIVRESRAPQGVDLADALIEKLGASHRSTSRQMGLFNSMAPISCLRFGVRVVKLLHRNPTRCLDLSRQYLCSGCHTHALLGG